MSLVLNEKLAVVTGAGRGIGRAISRMLAQAGATVFLTARTEDELKETAALIKKDGGEAMCFPADVANEDSVKAMFLTVEDQFGAPDVLVNNAGMGLYGALADFETVDFDKVVNVNLRGTFLCCKYAMKLMMTCRTGSIINISSVVGFKGYPNQSAYTAAKHGIMGLTKSLAVEAQEYGVRVSAVLPGGVDTDLVRQARPDLDPGELLAPEDVAGAVEYLLSLSDRAAVDQIYIRRRNSEPF